jgi:ferric-dicitrate binding protein FerR (iron transport regulator)
VDDRDPALEGLLAEVVSQPASPPGFEHVAPWARRAARRRRRAQSLRRRLPLPLALGVSVLVTAALTGGVLHHLRERPLAAGEILDAAGASRQARLPSGVRLGLASGRLVVDGADAHHSALRLSAGTAFLEVPPAWLGGRFTLRTDEAEVLTHGARFQVTRDAGGMRVAVSEGLVEVRPRVGPVKPFVVHRGGAGRVATLAEQRREARLAALGALARSPAEAEEHLQSWLATAPPPCEAAEAHALRGWRRLAQGDDGAAIESFRAALSLLPVAASPLWAENAHAQLALLLERSGAAAAVWRNYLIRFPGGTHAALARKRLFRDRTSGVAQ